MPSVPEHVSNEIEELRRFANEFKDAERRIHCTKLKRIRRIGSFFIPRESCGRKQTHTEK